MNVLRGTFRLSIVVALLVAAYFGITAHVAAKMLLGELETLVHAALWRALLGQDMSAYTNASG